MVQWGISLYCLNDQALRAWMANFSTSSGEKAISKFYNQIKPKGIMLKLMVSKLISIDIPEYFEVRIANLNQL